jgi:uncharacterized membrane protein
MTDSPPPDADERRRVRHAVIAAAIPAAVAFVIYVVSSVTRHLRFGSGSWDMGCYVHNLYILGFGKPPVSSVLGDAAFWGGTNHFMPSLYLAAPLAWTGVTSSLLVLQAALVAGAVIPLALLAHRRGLGPFTVAGVSLAYLFAVGTQTMIEFDVHEIAPVPLLLFLSLWAFETNRRALALASLVVMAGTKESAIVYAAAVGLWLAVTARGRRVEGVAIFLALLAWFFVVTQVIQPAFLEEGSKGMIHVARFKALGASPAEIASSVVLHPLRTLTTMISPAPKAQTLLLTTGGFAFLPLLAPEAWLLAGPTLAERFLSDKREMWGLGFHYSLVLVGVWAFGAISTLAWLKRTRLGARAPTRAFDVVAGVALVAALVATNAAAPFPPEFSSLQKPYMARPDEVARYERALAVIPDGAKVVAQNHFLPHLAFRQFIWQPEQRFVERADFIVLDENASPWPHTKAYVQRLVAQLRADPRFTIRFEEGSTLVFARTAASPSPAPTDRTPR